MFEYINNKKQALTLIITIMKKIFQITRIVALLMLVITSVSCDDDDVVLPQLTAEFTHIINQDTGTVTFINTSTNADAFSWSFGDANNTTSTEVNPIFTYPSGTYTITLEATNVAGASDTFEDTITISIPEVIGLPITFDNPLVSYDVTVFNGASFQVVENPDLSGTNAVASNVGEIVNSGAAFEGFFFNLGLPLNLSTDKSIKVNFWSNTPTSVLLKLESGTAADVEVTANHGGTGWEEIFFTFNSAGSYSITTFFVDAAGTSAGTFYIDDVAQINSSAVPCTETDLKLPIDFDCNGTDYAAKIVGNVNFTVVDNPELSGINNTPTKVGQLTNGGDNFENAFFNLDVPVDFTTDKGIRLKLYSTQALPILLKFEDGTEANVEDLQNHTGSGWEELTFELNSTGAYNDMILFVAFNQTDSGTFYVDDFEQVSVNSGPSCTPETSESVMASNLNITFQTDVPTLFGDNTGVSYIDNPDFSGSVNSSCRVAQVTRFNASPFDNVQIDLANKLDFNTSEGIRMKVWSPVANTPVLLKLEEIGNGGNFVEILQTTGAANTWTELTYDFPPTATPQFNKIVIFFNFNVANAGTYYFDDLRVYGTPGGGGTGSCPAPPSGDFISDGDFEANAGCWALFDTNTSNGGTTTISTTVSNGSGTNSGQIQTAQGGNPGIKQERFGVGSIQPNTTYVVSFDIKADSATPLADGAVFQAFTFSEPADGSGLPATQHVLIAGDATVTTSWSTRTYTFTTANNVDGGVSLLFELVCGGAATCGGIVNIDNVSFTAQ
jgi:hypothetical protein